MNIRQWQRSDVTFLAPQGRLDAMTAPQFKELVADMAKDHRKLVAVLSDLDFMDSSGISALVSAMRLVNDNKGRFALCDLNPQTRRVLEMVKLDKVLDILPDETRALEHFTDSPSNPGADA